MSDALPLLVVFGATGATGSHVVTQALESGALRVRAYVRSPEKLPEAVKGDEKFEFVEGTFAEDEKVQEACAGARYVICCAGDAAQSKRGPYMVPFVKSLIDGCQKHNVERLLYQAGMFSPVPGEKQAFMAKMMRGIFGVALGISGMVKENDEVIAILSENKTLKWVVTRPGAFFYFVVRVIGRICYAGVLGLLTLPALSCSFYRRRLLFCSLFSVLGMLKEIPSKGKAKEAVKAGDALAFTDLAAFNLAAVQTDEYNGKCPFLGY